MKNANEQSNIPNYLNVNTNHPLIYDSDNYNSIQKFITINSQDRDINKYPFSNQFEVELPQDYLNVLNISIYNWTLPNSYNIFSDKTNNVNMTFQINNPYNPGEHFLSDPLQNAIFEALVSNMYNDYTVVISNGNYKTDEMVTELTNKFNFEVSKYIINFFIEKEYTTQLEEFIANGYYQDFVIVYNTVKKNVWFGNRSSNFTLTNTVSVNNNKNIFQVQNCGSKYGLSYPDETSYGLPKHLGLTKLDENSITSPYNAELTKFFYLVGSAGDWLTPNPLLPGSMTSFIEATYKLELIGQDSFYIEVYGYSCIDEMYPYSASKFTAQTNQTSGIINASLMKIPAPVITNEINYTSGQVSSQFFPYRFFNPPVDRLRKLVVRLRYHNGSLVDLDNFNYSFMIKILTLTPQINKIITTPH